MTMCDDALVYIKPLASECPTTNAKTPITLSDFLSYEWHVVSFSLSLSRWLRSCHLQESLLAMVGLFSAQAIDMTFTILDRSATFDFI